MPEMISTGLKEYPPGRALSEGERFNVEHKHVRTLIATRLAILAGNDGEYSTRDMAAVPAVGYQTRDIVVKRKRGRPRKIV